MASRTLTLLIVVALAFAVASCGGAGAKVADCVGQSNGTVGSGDNSEPKATVVDCSSSKAIATLVSKMGKPLIHCLNIDPGSERDYNVSVAGGDFCARPR